MLLPGPPRAGSSLGEKIFAPPPRPQQERGPAKNLHTKSERLWVAEWLGFEAWSERVYLYGLHIMTVLRKLKNVRNIEESRASSGLPGTDNMYRVHPPPLSTALVTYSVIISLSVIRLYQNYGSPFAKTISTHRRYHSLSVHTMRCLWRKYFGSFEMWF